jgi:hypothetical protein
MRRPALSSKFIHSLPFSSDLARRQGLSSGLAKPPCFGRYPHQARQIGSASRTNRRAPKTSLANRATIRFNQTVRLAQFGRPPTWPSVKKSSSVSAFGLAFELAGTAQGTQATPAGEALLRLGAWLRGFVRR